MSVEKRVTEEDLRMKLAEIGGDLTREDLDAAEDRATLLLSMIQRAQAQGGVDDAE